MKGRVRDHAPPCVKPCRGETGGPSAVGSIRSVQQDRRDQGVALAEGVGALAYPGHRAARPSGPDAEPAAFAPRPPLDGEAAHGPMLLRRICLLVALAVAGFVFWWVWPLIGYTGEHVPALRGPGGWLRLPSNAPAAQTLHAPRYETAGALALEALQRRRAAIEAPALSAAVAMDGALVWSAAVGWADVEQRKRATPGTVFRIGTTSKAVTATGLARLVDEGVIELDEPLGGLRRRWPNRTWAPITPRQLVSHMAGLPSYPENGDWLGVYHSLALTRTYFTAEQALSVFDGSSLLFRPGTNFHYTSFGTTLLSAAMVDAAGNPFMALMKDRVFDPLRLFSTGADGEIRLSKAAAVSYQRWPLGRNPDGASRPDSFRAWRPVNLSQIRAGGGFASTPSDLARLGAAWLDPDFIRPQTRDAFWTPAPLPSGKTNRQNYALGWRIQGMSVPGVGRVRHANHGGISKGSQTWLMVAPDHGIAVALAMNARTRDFHAFASLHRDILAAFLLQDAPIGAP